MNDAATPQEDADRVSSVKKKTLLPLDVNAWEHETIGHVFHVTLDRKVAEQSGYDIVWLKNLADELEAEEPQRTTVPLNGDIIDRLLIARLELDPSNMTDDLDFLPVLASLPPQQTTFEYLVGCWKRLNSARSALMKKAYSPVDVQNALTRLEKVRELIVSYTGLTLQEPEMFPQPSGRLLGPPELVAPLLSLSALSAPLLGSSSSSPNTLTPSDIDVFLQDLTRRFEPDNEIDDVLGPVVRQLLFHESLFRPEGLGGGDAGWRGVVSGLEALVSIKGIAVMITRMEDFNPANATAATFEQVSLFGPLCRLGIFAREWGLQWSARDAKKSSVLALPIVSLNVKRAGMQVEPETVATDSFMVNLQSILLRFAEPFMDANYTKMDRIDPLFYARSKRIDLQDETRIKATSEEASKWGGRTAGPQCILKTLQRHLDMLQGDGSWMGGPLQARTEQAINTVKVEMAKIRMQQLAFEAQLLDPELVFRSIGFTNFLSYLADPASRPRQKAPQPPGRATSAEGDVPRQVRPFRQTELLIFVLTFLNSTWYIKNPFLKSKINDLLRSCSLGSGATARERNGLLGNMLNTHPMALRHLMPALTHFYIEVEQTGASSQFYDKFSARRNISYILKVVWDNPSHRERLNAEAARDGDKFVRFVNLMINDVTYLMDESLSELTQIHTIQREMDDAAAWAATPPARAARARGHAAQPRAPRVGVHLARAQHGRAAQGLHRGAAAPFMMPEIYRDLEVRDREKLKFNPKALLSDIVQAVAGDGRSYSAELFERAAQTVLKRGLKTEGEVEQLRVFVAKVEEARLTMEAEEDLGEVPDEFLDPLMFTVMRDPVLLPSSRTVIDRSTIKSHLLSDAKDPFNRVPLTIDEVIPDTALKARIEAFLIERRSRPALEVPPPVAPEDAGTDSLMDTT
ncbi:ubiquitin elongating factor core-domain-containing protein [Mycena olivaceomarginata]|nr:ubiquitin elongating factor core-domain-containing protein [Mycena olivaceomarginata]